MPRDGAVSISYPDTLSFADAIHRLANDPVLAEVRRRDLVSGLVSAARPIGLPPDTVPLDPAYLRPRLMAVHPLQAAIGKARLANIRSAVRAVLKYFGLAGNGRDAIPLEGSWAHTMAIVPDRYLRIRLMRLARFCQARGIDPAGVTEAVILALREDAARTTIGGSPRHSIRAIIQA